ncbi:MAG: hypothetical protein JST68_20320 [Bacteroidetes bacterium]|nr:hypothetical protein [Bacteroidota bacterium]
MNSINIKDELSYLFSKVFDKYEKETGRSIVRNTNRKNYEDVARHLSEISNQLPYTADQLGHEKYFAGDEDPSLQYPHRKFDITASQIKDAYQGIVSNPRPFLVDAAYIYLYGTGRKGFEKAPKDNDLVELMKSEMAQPVLVQHRIDKKPGSSIRVVGVMALLAATLFFLYKWLTLKNEWDSIKSDLVLLPHKPTQAEIDSLTGVWLCYTASPQARISNPNRYHLVVSNVVDVKYKNGYFVFQRYGASFNHRGYMQFEAPWLVAVYSNVSNQKDSIESPRYSLMRLDVDKKYIPVISASWNFDVGKLNNIIGIREVYIKQGRGGATEEVLNTLENASCKCKIVEWGQGNGEMKKFYVRNELLDSLPDENLKKLIDEKSILLREPQQALLLTIPDSGGTLKK